MGYFDLDLKGPWSVGKGAAPTIYNNGGLPTRTDKVEVQPKISGYGAMKLDEASSNANYESEMAHTNRTLNNGNYRGGGDNDLVGWASRNNPRSAAVAEAGGIDPRQQAWLEKTGNAGYQSGGLQGKQVFNYYDQDRPALMNNPANNPWADMARQLANFSALRSFDQKMHPEWYPGQNSKEMQIERLRGENHLAGIGLQGQNHLAGISLQGQNHLAGIGLQGRNQLDNTSLAYGLQGLNQEAHDTRAGKNAATLEELKQRIQANDPTRAAQALAHEAQARLYGTQADVAQRGLEFDKSADGSIQKWASVLMQHGGLPPEQALQQAIKMHLGSKRAYAEGGQIESPEQVMARIQAKYGVSGTQPQVQAPAPVQQPVRQQPQPQQPTGGLMDRLRNVATGGLDRRMQAAGFAEGGPIAVGGRSVVGAGTGKSDSLPAVIDGEHPAALSTGEFVMPVEAVRHFGLDKLNKMVAAARKGLDTGRESE